MIFANLVRGSGGALHAWVSFCIKFPTAAGFLAALRPFEAKIQTIAEFSVPVPVQDRPDPGTGVDSRTGGENEHERVAQLALA